MSYREEGNAVVLTMSREDYRWLSVIVDAAVCHWQMLPTVPPGHRINEIWRRLNSGNPNYTPYQTGEPSEKKS